MIIELKTLNELKTLEASPDSVILYGATWCNPCKQFRPHFERAAEEFNIPFAVVYLDELPDTTQDEQFKERSIMSVPTVRLFKDGQVHELRERRVVAFISELRQFYPRILRSAE